jgi:SAM-dependent methyltransferase
VFRSALSHNWLIFSIINPCIETRIKKYAKGTLLDIGCGVKPYMKMAAPYVKVHIGVDHHATLHDKSNIDMPGSAYDLPLEDDSVQTILCTDVLEHLEEPKKAIAESFRVLATGGYAIYTVPLFWHIHEAPRDYFRYTEFGLRYLFEECGYEVVEVKSLTGFVATFSQMLVYFLFRLRRGGRLNPLWWLIPPLGALIQLIAYMINKVDPTKDFTAEYVLVAQKPDGFAG